MVLPSSTLRRSLRGRSRSRVAATSIRCASRRRWPSPDLSAASLRVATNIAIRNEAQDLHTPDERRPVAIILPQAVRPTPTIPHASSHVFTASRCPPSLGALYPRASSRITQRRSTQCQRIVNLQAWGIWMSSTTMPLRSHSR